MVLLGLEMMEVANGEVQARVGLRQERLLRWRDWLVDEDKDLEYELGTMMRMRTRTNDNEDDEATN